MKPNGDIESLEDLEQKYPDLYSDVYCGMSCGKGWFGILHHLSERLHQINMQLPEEDRIRCCQIKEKFGGLRYYVNWSTKEADQFIAEAEKKSFCTCEECGAEGEERGGGWIRVLCDECERRRSAPKISNKIDSGAEKTCDPAVQREV